MMSETSAYIFHGDQRRRGTTPHPDAPGEPEPYVAPTELIQAVNLAIYLRRPLLLEGEAGCGKTRLARAVAYELGLPFYAWYVRSTSKAQEGLYSYDAILRLHDVQTAHLMAAHPATASTPERDPRNPIDYRRLGPLGKAFRQHDRPALVLIDEIDKADLDFPNDLLAVLDAPWSFEIPETGERIAAAPECKPIVIITSNKEKGNLPAPFLRRCIYSFVPFPESEDRLREIVDIHYQQRSSVPPTELVTAAAHRFLALRAEGGLFKKPGTSEFLDWLEAMQVFDPGGHLRELQSEGQMVPYPELLFKLRADWQRYARTR